VWLGGAGRSARIHVALHGEPDRRGVSIVAEHGSSPPARRELDRFTAVARAVAMGAEATLTEENVKVELRHVPE